MNEGKLLWTPSADFRKKARLTAFLAWLEAERDRSFDGYEALRRWSVEDLPGFWRAVWDYFEVITDAPPEAIVEGEGQAARWFRGSRVNYAEHVLRGQHLAGDEPALVHSSEMRPIAATAWPELAGKVRILATRLRSMGVVPGDRIVSYMPNVPETVIAMLASVAIGATWSSAAPDFGARSVIDRFGQIAPKVLFAADGYMFNGREFDRRAEVAEIIAGLPSLEAIVWLPYLGGDASGEGFLAFEEVCSGKPVDAEAFRFERVGPDHPLWILFSSGTTGPPKPIVHGHAGMLVEHLKVMSFHCNLGPGKRMFFYSTTGWMMWNTLVAAMMTGATAILYDGSPTAAGVDTLWRLAEGTGTTFFGASPTLVQAMEDAGLRPGASFDLSRIEAILLGGAPSTPETFAWLYENVGEDIWVTSQSGGTEICSGLVSAVPLLPVYAGEIQARGLGMDVHVWSDAGEPVRNEIGELVVTAPMPSAPLFFWGDADGSRYRESYYDVFPGVWRHGDLAKLNDRGGIYIYGRSDSTLNRFGVRIGTGEIYAVLQNVPGLRDSLIVCCETGDGGFYMPLFVTLEPGVMLGRDLEAEIIRKLRTCASPRHVPDTIVAAPGIPYTLTGKKMEVPVRKLLMGTAPEKALSRDAMADPGLFEWYRGFAARRDEAMRRGAASA